ncbi:MAG: isoaspartyl peptidase/L-asparaginase family protein [Pseudomonadota bacterium]
MYAIVVHGGAGDWQNELEAQLLAGVRRAAEAGVAILAPGGTALDAAVAAVVVLEDDPLFNAGTGSTLNLDGEAEMDAGVMVGQGLRSGNVAALRRVRNPVLVARKVLEETDHVLLAGTGAERFARAMGFAEHDPRTPERLAAYRRQREALARLPNAKLPRLHALLQAHPGLAGDTVGAVACDSAGNLAAATSTGGVSLKLAGRIGDSPVPGAGNYATPAAAASATGQGELMLRFLTTKGLCDLVTQGYHPQDAVEAILARMTADLGRDVGLIAVDATGQLGVGHATSAMPHAWFQEGFAPVSARMRVPL